MDSDEDESSEEEIKEIPIGNANKRRKGEGESDDEFADASYGPEGDNSMDEYGSEDEDDLKLKAKR
jgi:hypothetical protein